MQRKPPPLPDILRPVPASARARDWIWQVPLGVVLTLGALYLASALVEPCGADGGACSPTDIVVLPPAPDADAVPSARPVMALAYMPLPMAMAHAPPPPDYTLPDGLRVQDAATSPAMIALDQLSLIAVVEAQGQRHALVRLPDGRILRVREGDRLDGGSVAAIGPRTLYMLRTNNSPRALVLGG